MSKRTPKPPEVWSESVGLLPHRVTVEELPARRNGIYLRWWNGDKGNWSKQSLGNVRAGKPLRDDHGKLIEETKQWAVQLATRKYLELTGGIAPVAEAKRPFSIGETWAAISDPARGKYPHKTAFRDELERALIFASTVWGSARSWELIGEEDWSMLLRRRVSELVARGNVGVRATEVTMSRLITSVYWLRKTKRIPAGAAEPPDDWKPDLTTYWKGLTHSTRDPMPNRPRYTQDEALAILKVAYQVDVRLGLLLDLGAEYRLGQVVRCRRSDLDLDGGFLLVHGAGKKGGETIDLTPAQLVSVRAALGTGGYLEDREAAWQKDGTDYDLFPGGRLRHWRVTSVRVGTWRGMSRPIPGDTLRKWFRDAEELARVDGKPIKHVAGRGAYGIRREHVKFANDEGVSRFGLRAGGGWSSTKIPDEIYDEQENRRGRAEAKGVRSKFRREPDATAPAKPRATKRGNRRG